MKSFVIGIGALLGLLASPVCDRIEGFLLAKRGLEPERRNGEKLFLPALMALLGALIAATAKTLPEAVFLFLAMMAAELIAVIDLHHRKIPNDLVIAVIALRLVFAVPALLGVESFPEFRWLPALLGMAACFVIFLLPALWSRKVGAGDIKLAAAMGFCLGISGSLAAVVLMGLFVLGYTFLQKRMPMLGAMKSMIPMGPFLAGAMMLVLLAGQLPDFQGILNLI